MDYFDFMVFLMKIIRAYCIELERVVSIDEARAEFFL